MWMIELATNTRIAETMSGRTSEVSGTIDHLQTQGLAILKPIEPRPRPLVPDVAGIQGAAWLEQDHLGFLFGDRAMLNAVRDDQKVARREMDDPIAKFHGESSAMNQEKLVFDVMMVPDEGALKLHQFYQMPIHVADNFR